MVSVVEGAMVPAMAMTASSTASLAITRYVVYFPPATTTRPGAECVTTCSLDSLDVLSDSPASSGRSPAYTPSTSSWVSGVASTG